MTMAENSLIGSILMAVIVLAVMIWILFRVRAVWRGEKPAPNIPLSRKHRYFLGYHIFEVNDRTFPMFGMSMFSLAALWFFMSCRSLARIMGYFSLDHSLTVLGVFSLVMSFPLMIIAGLIFLVGHPKFLIPPSQRDGDAETAERERVAGDESLLDPDGILDDLLTVVVGIIGGFVIGLTESFVVATLLFFHLGLAVGILVWLGATAYLIQCRTVQEAISKAAYSIAIAIMSVSLIVFSPGWGTGSQALTFVILVVICAIPAVIAGGIGLLAARFVPKSSPEG
jgi:hypothetical protein